MSSTERLPALSQLRRQPIVLVVSATPLLYEALADSMRGFATLHEIPANRPDLIGLLRALHFDALVVDTPTEVGEIEALARELRRPLLHILLRERKVRVLRDDGFEVFDEAGASAESIRNLLVGEIFPHTGDR